MRRVLFTLGFVVALASALLVSRGTPADAITCSVAHVYTTGETLTSAVLNANPTQFNTCFASIDHLNIGPAGIYASQIIPTTAAQATFGGSIGYTFNPNATGQSALTLSNAASPTVDYLDVQSSTGTKYLSVDKNGVVNTSAAPSFGGVPSWTGALPVAQGGTGATTLAGANIAVTNANNNFTVPQTVNGVITSGAGNNFASYAWGCGSVNGCFSAAASGGTAIGGIIPSLYELGVTGVNNFWNIDTSGNTAQRGTLEAASASGNTISYLPPVYTASGGAVASTEHIVHVTGTFNSTLGACGPLTSNYYCATVTLSGAAAFSSGGTAFSVPPSFSCNFGAWIASTYAGYWFTGTSFGPVYMAASTPNTLYVATQQTSAAGNAFIFDCEGT